MIHQAFHVATSGRPGPVLVDIPKDVQFATGTYQPKPKTSTSHYQPQVKGDRRADHRAGRADRKGRTPGVLHRRRRDQLRPRGQPAAARTGRGHGLSDHLDPDGPWRLSGLGQELARDAGDARALRGQPGDARLRPDDQYRRALRRPDHRAHRGFQPAFDQGPYRHRPLVDQQDHPRRPADHRRCRPCARRLAAHLEIARPQDQCGSRRQMVGQDQRMEKGRLPRLRQLRQDRSSRNTPCNGWRR